MSPQRLKGSTFERALPRIEKTETCWLWRGGKNYTGYGFIRHEGKSHLAHRVMYEFLVGPIPEGLTLDHLCRNRACVNPAHLEPVTLAENKRRGDSPLAINARKTHCIHGHAFTAQNTYRYGTRRMCLECRRIRQRKAWHR